jgi:hypothetical protein
LALVQRRRGRTSFAVCDYDMQNLRRLDPQQLQSTLATGVVLYLFGLLGAGALLLQFFNIAIIDAFWPFFAGIVVHLLAAMFQFARIILLPPEA